MSVGAGMGLTAKQRVALDAVVLHVALHGAMPSRAVLAAQLGCNKNNAQRLITQLIIRAELHSASPGGVLAGFGSAGVAVYVPSDIAARLARYCAANGERVPAVVADAIALHLDALEAADAAAAE